MKITLTNLELKSILSVKFDCPVENVEISNYSPDITKEFKNRIKLVKEILLPGQKIICIRIFRSIYKDVFGVNLGLGLVKHIIDNFPDFYDKLEKSETVDEVINFYAR